MTREYVTFVYINAQDWATHMADVVAEAELCARRHAKALVGDQHEVGRYNALCAEVELIAQRRVEVGAPTVRLDSAVIDTSHDSSASIQHPWITTASTVPSEILPYLSPLLDHLQQGGAIVELRSPFTIGSEIVDLLVDRRIAPAQVWRPPGGERGIRAVMARWEGQLARAASGIDEPLVPSGVSNRVLTEGLRQWVAQDRDRPPVLVRVVYRDGSEARPFPLGVVPLTEQVDANIPIFRVALLSLRHPEMDGEIDAAWLRNREISQVRPAAETDTLVYETSRRQLADLARQGSRVIWLYQTGLEPAIVGFYRALTEHLRDFGQGIAVIPRFYRSNNEFEEGSAWARTT